MTTVYRQGVQYTIGSFKWLYCLICSYTWHRLPKHLIVQGQHCDHRKHPVTTTFTSTLKRKKCPKTGVKASPSGYQRKDLCLNVGNCAAVHHPWKNPSKRNQEMPITACGLKLWEEQAAFRRGKRLYWPHFHAEKCYGTMHGMAAISLSKLCWFYQGLQQYSLAQPQVDTTNLWNPLLPCWDHQKLPGFICKTNLQVENRLRSCQEAHK